MNDVYEKYWINDNACSDGRAITENPRNLLFFSKKLFFKCSRVSHASSKDSKISKKEEENNQKFKNCFFHGISYFRHDLNPPAFVIYIILTTNIGQITLF